MKKRLVKLLSLTLCAAMLCAVPAFAAESAKTPARLGPVRVWGAVSRLESGSLFLKNSNEDDPHHEIIVHISEQTITLDAVSGLPMAPADIRDGDTVYAWVGPAMTMSLPPQASAKVVVANIPAGFGAPMYHQVASVKPQIMNPIAPMPALTKVDLVTVDGTELTITDQARLQPHLTRNMVRLEMLCPGTEMMVWKDPAGTVSKVLVFPYAYKGYISWTEDGRVILNDQLLPEAARVKAPPATPIAALREPEVLLPVRAVAEAAGYTVRWDAEQGAVVEYAGEPVFSACPDTDVAVTPDGDWGLTAPCRIAGGVTYLPARDLVNLLDLFPVV